VRCGISYSGTDRYNRIENSQEFAMPKLNRDSVNIHYEVHGSGPPLLLTHGYSSTSAMWQGQIEALSKQHNLILWDMRGHGQSDYPDDAAAYSEALTVGDMAALLDKAGAASAIVGGLSLGGYMSLAFYRAHPKRVRALLIIDTGPGFKKDEARDAWNKRAHETGDRFDREGLAVLKSASRERSSVVHRDASGLARAAQGMLTQRDAGVIETLPHIKVPALVVVGADDTPFLAASDYMAAKIPGAQKVVIPAAGHAANIDQPQAFIDAVLPFLDSLPRQTASDKMAAS
jgi:pimeloyl-ACP methyl ester carboxylesterase